MKFDPIDIACPSCGKLAKFEEPFEFVMQGEERSIDLDSTHQWGEMHVIERFPNQIPWEAPKNKSAFLRGSKDNGEDGYPLLTNGLVRCSHCHINTKHRLNWPQDAYWQWNIRGELLWAWDKNNAFEILAFIKATQRPTRKYTSLRYIPSHFLSAKVRELVVNKMQKSLSD